MSRNFFPKGLIFILLLSLAGCAGHRSFLAGEQMTLEGRHDEAVARYSEALEKDPDNYEYRIKLNQAKFQAAREHLEKGRTLRRSDRPADAFVEFRLALDLDPTLETASREMKETELQIEIDRRIAQAREFLQNNRLPQAKNNLNFVLQIDPGNVEARELMAEVRTKGQTVMDGFDLDVSSDTPITLKFKDARVQDVFKILTQLSGINFIFDEDVKTEKVTVHLENATFGQALDLVLNMNKLGKKVLNSKTIIIYPKTKDKEKLYQDQIIQTFYLSNIDAKKAVNLLRTMLQLRKIYVHEELNAIVIRDTPEAVKLSQQILEAADRADSEVVFDVEVIEVGHTDLLNLGPRLSTYQISGGFGEDGTIVSSILPASGATDTLVHGLNDLEFFYTLPTATFDFAKTLGSAEILAQPKIRVKNKDKAKVHIGTREPVITVTTTGDSTRSDNIQYIDVGVKLDIEPTIQLDDTVVTKVTLEVSSVSDRQQTNNGSVALTITTTNATSALTLKDGEQTIIGGLLRDDNAYSKTTFPLLGELPLIGDLISGHRKENRKREILLSITPHIVKSVDLPRADVASIWSGGEDDLKAGPTFGAFAETFTPETEQMPRPVVPGQVPPPAQPRAPTLPRGGGDTRLAPPKPVPAKPAAVAPRAGSVPPKTAAPAMEEEEPDDEDVSRGQATAAPAPAAISPKTPVPAPSPSLSGAALDEAYTPILSMDEEPSGELVVGAPPTAAIGEEFSVVLRVQGAVDLSSAPLALEFKPQILEFVRAEEGDFFKQEERATVFTANPDSAKGVVLIGSKPVQEGVGVSGDGVLYRVVFRAKAPGAAPVALHSINFQDSAGNRFEVPKVETSVEVK